MQEIINTIATTGTPLYILHEARIFVTDIALLYVLYQIGKLIAYAFKKASENF